MSHIALKPTRVTTRAPASECTIPLFSSNTATTPDSGLDYGRLTQAVGPEKPPRSPKGAN
jgi:hypothetical protein